MLFYGMDFLKGNEKKMNLEKECVTLRNDRGYMKEAFKAIKLITLDLDGTLLTSDKRITSYNWGIIERCRKQGYLITVMSGRHADTLDKFNIPLVLDAPMVGANGAQIASADGKTTLEGYYVEEKSAKALTNYLYAQGFEFWIRGIVGNEMEQYYRTGQQETFAFDYAKTSKFNARHQDERKIQALKAFCQAIQVEIFHTGGGMYEIGPKGITKGTGLLRICEILHLDARQCLCIGDNDNDVAAFQTAGISVAMENASEKAKESAKYICGSNDEDGVGKFLEQYLLCE